MILIAARNPLFPKIISILRDPLTSENTITHQEIKGIPNIWHQVTRHQGGRKVIYTLKTCSHEDAEQYKYRESHDMYTYVYTCNTYAHMLYYHTIFSYVAFPEIKMHFEAAGSTVPCKRSRNQRFRIFNLAHPGRIHKILRNCISTHFISKIVC